MIHFPVGIAERFTDHPIARPITKIVSFTTGVAREVSAFIRELISTFFDSIAWSFYTVTGKKKSFIERVIAKDLTYVCLPEALQRDKAIILKLIEAGQSAFLKHVERRCFDTAVVNAAIRKKICNFSYLPADIRERKIDYAMECASRNSDYIKYSLLRYVSKSHLLEYLKQDWRAVSVCSTDIWSDEIKKAVVHTFFREFRKFRNPQFSHLISCIPYKLRCDFLLYFFRTQWEKVLNIPDFISLLPQAKLAEFFSGIVNILHPRIILEIPREYQTEKMWISVMVRSANSLLYMSHCPYDSEQFYEAVLRERHLFSRDMPKSAFTQNLADLVASFGTEYVQDIPPQFIHEEMAKKVINDPRFLREFAGWDMGDRRFSVMVRAPYKLFADHHILPFKPLLVQKLPNTAHSRHALFIADWIKVEHLSVAEIRDFLSLFSEEAVDLIMKLLPKRRYIQHRYVHDHDLAKCLVQVDGLFLRYFLHYQNDIEVLRLAVQNNPAAWQFCSDEKMKLQHMIVKLTSRLARGDLPPDRQKKTIQLRNVLKQVSLQGF